MLPQTVKHLKRSAMVLSKRLLTRSHLGRRLLLPKYRYMFSPEQLWALCQAAESRLPLGGSFAEIGVYDGATTTFLHRHLKEVGGAPRYYCIDTFSGFTRADVGVERERGKNADYDFHFFFNSKESFERTMALSGIDRAVVIQADASSFDYSTLSPLSFVLVDLDLYRPVKAALAGCWEQLLPGGIIVVDDCTDAISEFDGALQAYQEFCDKEGAPVDIRHKKLGFLVKPPVEMPNES